MPPNSGKSHSSTDFKYAFLSSFFIYVYKYTHIFVLPKAITYKLGI